MAALAPSAGRAVSAASMIDMATREPPYTVEGEFHPIKPGICFSIEPGIYLPGRLGVRIEDIVVATEDGAGA